MPKRTDANQAEIVRALRQNGARVQDLHEVGHGCPDILVGFRGRNFLFEIKMPGEKLNEIENKWHSDWRGIAYIVYSADDALNILFDITEDYD